MVVCVLFLMLIFSATSCGLNTNNEASEDITNFPAESPNPNEQVYFNSDESTENNEVQSQLTESDEQAVQTVKPKDKGELRGIWISYLDYENLIAGKNKSDSKESFEQAFSNIKDMGLNTVFVQVRPFADALYNSNYFPWSHVIMGEQAVGPEYDPLELMIQVGHSMDLEIHAWINPYRVQLPGRPETLSEENLAKKWLDSGSDNVIQTSEGIFFNPASTETIDLVLDGVEEILNGYDVDGIHFDDYFYPTTDASFDSKSYKEYQSNGGDLELSQWRIENVNTLVQKTYSLVKQINADIVFGISPQGSIENNYNSQYADVKTWCENNGYIDYIMPQIYYGYENEAHPYTEAILEWDSITKDSTVDLYIGLASYKIGLTDKWAGTGADEWTVNNDVLMRQVIDARTLNNYNGFVLYRYDSIFRPDNNVSDNINAEISNLTPLMD